MKRRKATKATCAKCEGHVDRTACNQVYAVLTVVEDRDETGVKNYRRYVCGDCLPRVELALKKERTGGKNLNTLLKIFAMVRGARTLIVERHVLPKEHKKNSLLGLHYVVEGFLKPRLFT